MNKTELIAAVAEKAEISRKDAEKALKAFVDVVTDEMVKGEKVQVVGFGTFEVTERTHRDNTQREHTERKEREGRNLQTGEPMTIPASKTPKFRPEKALKDLVNA